MNNSGTIVKEEIIGTFNIDLNPDRMAFVKALTGKQDQDAVEHFTSICLEYNLDPQTVLNSVTSPMAVLANK